MGFFRNYLPFRWRKISGFFDSLTCPFSTGCAGGRPSRACWSASPGRWPAPDGGRFPGFLTVSIKTSSLAGGFAKTIQKSSQSLPPAGGKSSEIIFARGVYLGENTSQSASVEFVRFQRTNYARSRLQSFCRKNRRVFRQS